jgi:muramoyltetrapeptide carboxypeptidase
MAKLSRRQFLAASAAVAASGASSTVGAGGAAISDTSARRSVLLPPALKPGDTIGIISPANATYPAEPYALAEETLRAMGYQVRFDSRVRNRWGHFGGSDAERAAAVNRMFADPQIAGILPMTGGSGCTRLLDRIDFDLIRRNPKFIGGFSDLTVLLNAIHARTGLITFHSPTASSEWNTYSRNIFERMVIAGEALTLSNPLANEDLPVQRRYRTRALTSGKARGHLIGGNLTVLATLAGTACWPNFDGAILFIEDVNEYLYRVDRVLAHLKQAGALRRLAGVVIGQFTKCEPGEGYATLTLDEIFADYFGSLGVPTYSGAQFGHVAEKMTLPVGAEVEIDADRGELRLLAPVVRRLG